MLKIFGTIFDLFEIFRKCSRLPKWLKTWQSRFYICILIISVFTIRFWGPGAEGLSEIYRKFTEVWIRCVGAVKCGSLAAAVPSIIDQSRPAPSSIIDHHWPIRSIYILLFPIKNFPSSRKFWRITSPANFRSQITYCQI